MNDLENACHPKAVFIIQSRTSAIIYPEDVEGVRTWVLAIGSIYKTNDWRKCLGRYRDDSLAVQAAKDFGFGAVSVRHPHKPRSWTRKKFWAERTWRQIYSDNRAQGPIPPHRRGIRYGIGR